MIEASLGTRPEPSTTPEINFVYLYHISIKAFPVPEPDLTRLKSLLDQIIAGVVGYYGGQLEYFIQAEYIIDEWDELLTNNASYWEMQTGLGFHPNHPLPDLTKSGEINMESFMGEPGGPHVELELIYHIGKDRYFERLFPEMEWPSPLDIYLGCGGLLLFMVSDGDKFLRQMQRLYTAGLGSAFQDFDFHLPLFDLEAFEKASSELLEEWFNLFDICILETKSDPGILIASRHNLDGLLAGFQSVFIGENSV
jgi:hypothetical protein